jgi:hypothetical protein
LQPTIEAELLGAQRLLEPLAADPTLPADVTGQIKTVMQLLKRLERSWPRFFPHLAEDNARTAELLRELAPALSAELQSEIETTLSNQVPALDVTALNRHNEALRDLLARAIPEAGSTARMRIVAGLREGLETRPW